jgi:hydroxymethylpyrimidine pyrophosphatase-like HAD family hydrolase
MSKHKFPPSKCVAIDVDGTLLIDGKLNRRLASWAARKKANGYEVLLWSAQGRRHAKKVAQQFGITEHFTSIISKPGYIVDDLGWTWTKYTKVIKGLIK